MRLSVYILGAFTAMVIILGSLFKLMHWAGADMMIVLGWSMAAILYVPLFSIYKYRKGKTA
ncbi:GldL-related protein [Pontibacter sp. H249]|uniref:GldL-related protein n=1 Tax=Pontibacter sp. H249 TaxID=3133420 RepID=UPI0030BA82DC